MLAVAWISFASGVGQFGVVSALGDVARTFGHVASGTTVADQAGLSGASLGLGLAVIRSRRSRRCRWRRWRTGSAGG